MISIRERINIFVNLGELLQKGVPDEIIECAVAENEWFSADDIRYAVAALADDMLTEKAILSVAQGIREGAKQADVAIIMAGNIPAVGFADLMYVLLAGHRAWVKFSHKDCALMSWIVKNIALNIENYTPERAYDAVIATGGESANRYFRRQFAGIPSICRSSRSSVAVLRGSESDWELGELSDDIFRYNNLGCRSVSLLIVPQSTDIKQLARKIAPLTVHPKYAKNYQYTRARLITEGIDFIDGKSFVMVESGDIPTDISQLNYLRYSDLVEVDNWIKKHQAHLQCVIGREIKFGRAQHPSPTDFADKIDVIKFLETV